MPHPNQGAYIEAIASTESYIRCRPATFFAYLNPVVRASPVSRKMTTMSVGGGDDTPDVEQASAQYLERLDVAVLFAIISYLQTRELYPLACVSHEYRAVALDEEVWRMQTRKAFSKVSAAYEPVDRLWRAEFLAQKHAAKREADYMRALSQGRVGKVEPPPARLGGSRFAALESRERAEAAAAARAAALAPRRASGAGGMISELQANISNASKGECVTIRQGSAMWSSLRG